MDNIKNYRRPMDDWHRVTGSDHAGTVSSELSDYQEAQQKFLTELPGVTAALTRRLANAYQNHAEFSVKAHRFLELCQRTIGPQITYRHIDDMLIQHLLTEQTFLAIFPSSLFHRENHLAHAMAELALIFLHGEARVNLLSRLEPYFAAIRHAAAHTITSADKQRLLKQVYEDFYAAYHPKDADKLGVVYTPNEVVRFIIEGCDWLMQQHFDHRLADEGVDILDPCTGTGTFIVDLIDYMRGDRHALIKKFDTEIHANEIAILPYYIACLNIEQSFYEATDTWKNFKGACFINTLDNWGFDYHHRDGRTDINHDRIVSQNTKKIPVIIGNPPYNANQKNENDDNKNAVSVITDRRIKETYIAASRAQKTKMYDPYIRFFRWASDRIGDAGIIGLITNRSWIDSRQADGFRRVVATEFQAIYVIDLAGNARQMDGIKGEQGGNIFGIMTGVAIVFLVRHPKTQGCTIRYIAAPKGITGPEKLRWLASSHLRKWSMNGELAHITPNTQGEWINPIKHGWSDLSAWMPVACDHGRSDHGVFQVHSPGINSGRDEWVYGASAPDVLRAMQHFIKVYEDTRQNHIKNKIHSGEYTPEIKWSRNLKRRLMAGRTEVFNPDLVCQAIYRPFVTKYLYRSPLFVDEKGASDTLFPTGASNVAIWLTKPASQKPFMVLASTILGDCHLVGAASGAECLPLYFYDACGTRHDNITDWALQKFRVHYDNPTIEKQAIFNYVYAILHHPAYRQKYAQNLKSEFPHIPFYADFRPWSDWGQQLITLHTEYSHLAPYPLHRTDQPIPSPLKCRLKAHISEGWMEIDTVTTLSGVPPQAWLYQLAGRSALEWVLDAYRDFVPKDPTVRDKFHDYRFADHQDAVIALLGQVCQVSVATVAIMQAMSASDGDR